jgi:hypothetical protein
MFPQPNWRTTVDLALHLLKEAPGLRTDAA